MLKDRRLIISNHYLIWTDDMMKCIILKPLINEKLTFHEIENNDVIIRTHIISFYSFCILIKLRP